MLPGPSAVETALVASGLVGERYRFVGYLPRRDAELARARARARALAVGRRSRSSRPGACRRRSRPRRGDAGAAGRGLPRADEAVRGGRSRHAPPSSRRGSGAPEGRDHARVGGARRPASRRRATRRVAAVAELVAAGVDAPAGRRRRLAARRASPGTRSTAALCDSRPIDNVRAPRYLRLPRCRTENKEGTASSSRVRRDRPGRAQSGAPPPRPGPGPPTGRATPVLARRRPVRGRPAPRRRHRARRAGRPSVRRRPETVTLRRARSRRTGRTVTIAHGRRLLGDARPPRLDRRRQARRLGRRRRDGRRRSARPATPSTTCPRPSRHPRRVGRRRLRRSAVLLLRRAPVQPPPRPRRHLLRHRRPRRAPASLHAADAPASRLRRRRRSGAPAPTDACAGPQRSRPRAPTPRRSTTHAPPPVAPSPRRLAARTRRAPSHAASVRSRLDRVVDEPSAGVELTPGRPIDTVVAAGARRRPDRRAAVPLGRRTERVSLASRRLGSGCRPDLRAAGGLPWPVTRRGTSFGRRARRRRGARGAPHDRRPGPTPSALAGSGPGLEADLRCRRSPTGQRAPCRPRRSTAPDAEHAERPLASGHAVLSGRPAAPCSRRPSLSGPPGSRRPRRGSPV